MGVTTIGYNFLAYSNIGSLILPPNLKSIGSYAFNNATINYTIIFPEGFLSTTGGNFFWDVKGTSGAVILPSTTTIFSGGGNFGYIRSPFSVILKCKTPPTLTSSSYVSKGHKVRFYVPDEAIEEYKNAATWSTYYGYGIVLKHSDYGA